MASHTDRGGNTASKTADEVKNVATKGAKSVREAVDSRREQVADAIDDAADTVGEKGEKLHDVADYVRDAHPLASLLVLGAVVIGGGMLVAAMLHDDGPANGSGDPRRPMGLAAVASGMGPRVTETLSRIRDAAFSFALAKVVDTVDGMFPGFREHYERA